MKTKFPIEYVKWIDHFSVDEWKQVEDIDAAPAPVESVGWLVKENETVVMLAVNHTDNKTETSCTMVIMKSCIVERKRIKDVKKVARRTVSMDAVDQKGSD